MARPCRTNGLLADGLVVRPGPRLVDGIEALAAVLHPGAAGTAGTVPAGRIRRVA